MTFPAILAQHPHIEQHPAVQKILSPGTRAAEFFSSHFHPPSQVARKPQRPMLMPEDGFLILQRKICLMQDGTVAADGQDDVGARKAFFQRKVLYTFHVAGLFQVSPASGRQLPASAGAALPGGQYRQPVPFRGLAKCKQS